MRGRSLPASVSPTDAGARLQDDPVAVGVPELQVPAPGRLLHSAVHRHAVLGEACGVALEVVGLDTSPVRDPAGIESNQVTSVSEVCPPGGATCTQRLPGPIASSRTSSKPSTSR